jgi:hypothetical protein
MANRIEVGMLQRRFESPADHVLLQHCVCRCYSRLIRTSWFQWCHCHCCWRSGRLSFAMVGKFRVGDVDAKRKVIETTCIYTVKESRVFLCPFFYGDPVHILQDFLSWPVLRSQTRFYRFSKESARLSSIITVFFQASKLMPACSPCWSFLSLDGGFRFRSCANGLSVCSMTS